MFLDPGMGKTVCILEYLKIMFGKKMMTKVLIIAPLRVAQVTWPDEIDKWGYKFKYVVLHGSKKNELLKSDADIFLINPEGLKWLLPLIKRQHFDTLIVDESTKFKNWSSGRTKLLKSILHMFNYRHILTGTPVPNGLMDIFSQIYIVDMGAALGRFITQFRNRYFNSYKVELKEHDYSVYDLKPDGEERIYKAIKKTVARLSEKDYLDLPSLVPVTIDIELGKSARKVYSELENEYLSYIDGNDINDKPIVAGGGGALVDKLRQVAGGAVYDDDKNVHHIHNEKITALKDLLEQLSGQPCLIAYTYKHEKDRLRKALTSSYGNVVFVDDHKKNPRALVKSWNSGEIDVLVAQCTTISHGLNMQECGRAIIWFALTYDYDTYYQFIKRVWRTGVKNTVFLYHLVIKDSIDEDMMQVLTNKEESQEKFLERLSLRVRKRA